MYDMPQSARRRKRTLMQTAGDVAKALAVTAIVAIGLPVFGMVLLLLVRSFGI